MKDTLNLDDVLLNFTHIVDRKADIKWRLDDVNEKSNLILIYEGEAYIEVDGQGSMAKAGDLIYFRRGVKRLGYTFEKAPMKCYAVCCDLRKYDDQQDCLDLVDVDLPLIQTINGNLVYHQLVKLFGEMVEIWTEKKAYMKYDLNSCFYKILKLLVQWREIDAYNYEQDSKVRSVMTLMTHNLKSSLTVDQISSEIGVSVSYLSRIFKETTGLSMMRYYNQLKIEKSKDYLGAGISVGNCAEMLGYSDLYYFSKVFKQFEGISPSLYAKGIV